MSVINDMLRDLDKRQAPEVSSNQQVPHESLIEPQTAPYKKWLFAWVGLVILSALVYFFLFQEKGVQTANNLPVSEEKAHAVPSDNLEDQELNLERSTVQDDKLTSKPDSDIKNTKLPNEISLSEKTSSEKVSIDQVPVPTIKTALSKEESITEPKEESKIDTKSVVTLEEMQPKKAPIDQPALAKQAQQRSQKLNKIALPSENSMKVKLSPVALDQQMAERATKLITQRQELLAYRELYEFIGEHEQDMESRTVLASYLLHENRIAEAGDVLLNAQISRSPKLRQIKARWYAAQGRHHLAITTLNSNLPSVEEFPDYYVLLAAYYQRYGSAADASETYALLVDYNENIADWWAGLGLASDRNRQPEKAIFAYRQALELSGLSPELMNFVKPRLKQLIDSLPEPKNEAVK